MELKDLRLDAAPLLKGGIEMGLAVAGGLLKRGVFEEMLQSAHADQICQAIFQHIVEVLTARDQPWDFEVLLDTIQSVVEMGREGHLLQ